MIKNLVIDTNIWLGIIEKEEFDLLDKLFEGIENSRIKLLLPECIESEFIKKIKSNWSDSLKKRTKISQNDFTSLIQTISEIFNLSNKLKNNEIGLVDWVNSKKAPNHNANNYEDTVVLNTLLNLKEGSDLCLITNDIDYRSGKNSFNLHSDIIEKFKDKKLKINLSTNLLKTLNDIGLSKPKNSKLNIYELYNWKAFKLQVKNQSILNQLSKRLLIIIIKN